MRTTQGAADFDLLGGQLFEAVKFARSDFDSAAKLFDHVRNENLAASEMFYADRLRWFMVGDSLPGDVSVKALGVDRRALDKRAASPRYGDAFPVPDARLSACYG